VIEGALIGESLRTGAELSGPRLAVTRIGRAAMGDPGLGQPALWTFFEFEADEGEAEPLARLLAQALLAEGGWYADFRTPRETWVVYAGRVFRYPRGDAAGRAEAVAYGRARGVPEDQLDWPV
jgi:hypothetical protein